MIFFSWEKNLSGLFLPDFYYGREANKIWKDAILPSLIYPVFSGSHIPWPPKCFLYSVSEMITTPSRFPSISFSSCSFSTRICGMFSNSAQKGSALSHLKREIECSVLFRVKLPMASFNVTDCLMAPGRSLVIIKGPVL